MARASKRAENVIKFIETYCYVPEGKYVGKKLKLEPFQKKFITSVYTSNRRVRRAYLSIARKNGKALCLDTKLPTPDGWVRMGDVKEGDVLFDEKGNKCRVTFATPVQHKRNCFRVRFADGAEIIADADHQWTVNSRSRRGKEVTLTTAQMVGDYILDSNRDTHVERNYSVSVAGSVKCDETNLIVEPYALGAWLGDGDSAQAALTGSVEDGTLIAAEIERRGTIIRRIADGRTASRWSFSDGVKNRSKKCVQKDLREIKVLHNKHIPIEYQRSSVDQRMSLLRGLMDTDGSISKAGQCEFVSVSKTLAFDTMSLIRGLGFKASMKIDRARVNGKDCGPRYRVQFWSTKDNSVFHLPRKHERQKDALGARNSRNYIVAIEPVESVPVRCIQVDSPSSLFLAGEAFTPTHNTAFIAAILLAHIVGPEAVLNSQIISGARSRDQAALVFNLAVKMIHLNPELESRCRIIPSGKKIIGLARNVEFHAVSAEAGTAHGLSPILAILDEVGQVRGDHDAFIEAIETSQGAYDEPLLIAISTQAATDGDLFSMWLDDAKASKDPAIVSHLYSAPEDCDIMDRKAWYAANPALGKFRSLPQLEREMEQASRLPSKENSARWLYLNQRIEASSPFLSRKLWQECLTDHSADFTGLPIYGGLDLSEVADLTACVLIAKIDDKWHTKPTFWLPGEGLREKSIRERVPYDRWAAANFLETTPGRSIEYEYVAKWLRQLFNHHDVRQMAFDRWNYRHLRPWLEKEGFTPEELERFIEFGQGYASMSPALRDLESLVLNGKLQHDGHPVLTMCAANAVVQSDPAGNKKLVKNKSAGRIDGMVALAMACSVAATEEIEETGSYLDDGAEMVIL